VRGVWLDGRGVALVQGLPAPAADRGPAGDEVRVRVHVAGLCSTDVALSRGYMAFRGVPGHEFVGTALDGPLSGRRVVGEINAGCGRCPRCAARDPRHCPERTVLGILGRPGAMAEELTLPRDNLLPVPDAVPDDEAVFAEPLAAALALGEAAELAPGTRALVVGDGKLGLLCAWVLSLAGCAVEVRGRHPERAPLLPPGAVYGGAPGRDAATSPWPLVVEASGDPALLAASLAAVEPRGTLVLKSTCERPALQDLAPLVVNAIRVVGSRCGRMGPALALLERRVLPLQRWIAGRYRLDDAPRAFERAASGGVLKLLVDVSSAGG
jgi:threonine dehydrogenase-like Zn-dependent dehydrogenase